MRYVYGPVPSRRLGVSLGVSPIPAKTCTYSCIYCQLGRTSNLTVQRRMFFSEREITAEIEKALQKHEEYVDYVTFVGDGESTLYSALGEVIESTRALGASTAVITNGALMFREDVRNDLVHADVVLATVSAGDSEVYRRIHRPHPSLEFDEVINGMVEFGREARGELWVETMLVKGVNDSHNHLKKIARAIAEISPKRVFITIPIRPPAEPWVRPPGAETLRMASEIIKNAEIIDYHEEEKIDLSSYNDAVSAIMSIGRRHPLRLEQARTIEKFFDSHGVVEKLIARDDAKIVEYYGKKYIILRRRA